MIALLLRLGFLAWRGPTVAPDTADYLLLAGNLARSRAYSLDEHPPLHPSIRRSPAYPAFLATLARLGAESPAAVAAVQAGLDALVAALIVLIAWPWGGARALLAGVIYAFHPGAVSASSALLSETLFTLLLTLGAWYLASAVEGRPMPGLIAGLLLGGAALCRPVALLVPIALALLILLARSVRQRAEVAVLLVLGAVLVVGPWVLRSSRLAGRLVLVQAGAGANLYVPSRSDWDQKDEASLWRRLAEDPVGRRLSAARTPSEVATADREALRQAGRNIVAQPGAYLASRVRSFPHLFLTSFDSATGIDRSFTSLWRDRNASGLLTKGVLLLVFSLLPFVLAVAGLFGIRTRPAAAVSAVVWSYLWIVHLPLWIEPRFWWPAIPSLLVTASLGAAPLERGLLGMTSLGRRVRPLEGGSQC